MLVVNLEKYSDFDMPVTVSTWMSQDYDSLLQTGLTSSLFENDHEVEKAERELKKLGFNKMKVAVIRVGGNL